MARRPRTPCVSCRHSTIASKPCCSARPRWRRNIRKARSRGRSRSMLIIRSTRRRRSMVTIIVSRSVASSTREAVDARRARTDCRRSRKSPATSASKVGARSVRGRACGYPISQLIGADLNADMSGSSAPRAIPVPSTCRPPCIRQTQLTLKFDRQTLPTAYGFPIKIRIPTKLGFKNPKYVTAMWVQNNDAGGYWENQGYNWFSGL